METLGHATPDQVYAEVRTHSQSINLSTVYRTLELLDELGLIRHAHLSDRAPTYHSARGHEHAHLICRDCQKEISIGLDEMGEALGGLAAARGFVPDYGHLTVFGQCAECAGGRAVAATVVEQRAKRAEPTRTDGTRLLDRAVHPLLVVPAAVPRESVRVSLGDLVVALGERSLLVADLVRTSVRAPSKAGITVLVCCRSSATQLSASVHCQPPPLMASAIGLPGSPTPSYTASMALGTRVSRQLFTVIR